MGALDQDNSTEAKEIMAKLEELALPIRQLLHDHYDPMHQVVIGHGSIRITSDQMRIPVPIIGD